MTQKLLAGVPVLYVEYSSGYLAHPQKLKAKLMIRAYQQQDKTGVIQLLRLNTPEYFAEEEKEELLEYLQNHAQYYYIYEASGQIIGAGGINYGFDHGKTARISWDIIHPEWQGKGIGSKLTAFRINKVKENKEVNKIVVRTTQMVYRFYQKSGFRLKKTQKDFWAPGFDLYQLEMKVD